MTPFSFPAESSADSSPMLPQLNPRVTSEVAEREEKESNHLSHPMTERDKPDLSALSDADLEEYIHACAKRSRTPKRNRCPRTR